METARAILDAAYAKRLSKLNAADRTELARLINAMASRP